jgi:hypothetical protein
MKNVKLLSYQGFSQPVETILEKEVAQIKMAYPSE